MKDTVKAIYGRIREGLDALRARIGFHQIKTTLDDLIAPIHHKNGHREETLVLGSKITSYEKGECAIQMFKEAKHSVIVTHFSTERMSEAYLKAQEEALRNGIHVTRIIPESLAPYTNEQFSGWETKYKDFYKSQIYVGTPPPLDFAVIDNDKKVLLALPTEENADRFSIALILSDPQLVRAFVTMYALLLLSKPPDEDEVPAKRRSPARN